MDKLIYTKELHDWDKNADFYNDESDSAYKKILIEEAIMKSGLNQSYKKVLDIGAGIGDFGFILNQKFKINVTSLDFSVKMQQFAKIKFPKTKYILSSAHKLPISAHSFDAVVVAGVMHHLKAQGIFKEGLTEILRVLKPKGLFILLDRSNRPGAVIFEKLLASLKNIFLFFKGTEHAACSTSSEVSLDDTDMQIINSKFQYITSYSMYSLPFKAMMVFSHGLNYIFGRQVYLSFQKISAPLANFMEQYLNFCFWETEMIVIYKNK